MTIPFYAWIAVVQLAVMLLGYPLTKKVTGNAKLSFTRWTFACLAATALVLLVQSLL